MKNIILTIMLTCLAVGMNAQQRYPGQWIFKASGGATLSSSGYYGEVGIEKLFNNSNSSIQVSFMYNQNKQNTSSGLKADIKNSYGLIDYAYTIPVSHGCNIALLGGFFLGYQKVPEKLHEDVTMIGKSRYCYGINVAAQFDFPIARRVSFYVQPTVMYNLKSDIDDWTAYGGAGFKFYF